MKDTYYNVKGIKAKGKKQNNSSLIFHPSSSGFTLLEIMIALAIIGIALTVIIHTVNYHANVMYDNTLTTQMYQLAKEKMYELKAAPQNAKGDIGTTGFKYENTVSQTIYPEILELKTVVKGYGKQVMLNELIIFNDRDRGE